MAGFANGCLVLDPSPFTTSTGDNNDVPMSGSLMFVTVTTTLDAITGLIPSADGGVLAFVSNLTPAKSLVLKNNSSASLAANRIFTVSGSDLTLASGETAMLGYDPAVNIGWHVIKLVW